MTLCVCLFLCIKICRTLTSHVELLECLEAIKEHAFSSSPYPVVLNLENHLTPDLQAKTAMVWIYFFPFCHVINDYILIIL